MLTSVARKIAIALASCLVVNGVHADQPGGAPSAELPIPSAQAAETGSRAADLGDPVALGAFVDGVMKAHMDQLKIPGAVVAVVGDGRVLYAQGYGHADIQQGTRIDAATSMFRIASVTKLFTWTAVMQLVEQGKLNLDTDVNVYLKTIKIPATYPQPITLRHLMTHSAGFEEMGVGFELSTDPQRVLSIADAAAGHMPARIRPPGAMVAYSNYSATLAGLIVEQVSGLAYEDYVQKFIFEPLGMRYATVREPLPQEFAPYRVLGYQRENGEFVAPPPTFEDGSKPAGSAAVSALDMARFMLAHLQEGRYGEARLLAPETARLMHSTSFALDKRLPGMCLGFYELSLNGQRVIAHGGSDPLFSTEAYLVPERKVGIFVSYSGGRGGEAAEALMKAFFDRYFPVPEFSPPPVPADFAQHAGKYAGTYVFTRRNQTKIDKFYSLPAQISIEVAGDRLVSGSGEEGMVFAPIGPELFQQVGGPLQIAFRVDAEGNATHLFLDSFPFMPLERTTPLDNSRLWYPLLGICVAVFMIAVIVFASRWRRIAALPTPRKRAAWLAAAAAGWALITCITGFQVLMAVDVVTKLSRIPTSLNVFLAMPIIFVGMTIALLVSTVVIWKDKYWGVAARVCYTTVTLAAMTLSLFFQHWNLLGWRFG